MKFNLELTLNKKKQDIEGDWEIDRIIDKVAEELGKEGN